MSAEFKTDNRWGVGSSLAALVPEGASAAYGARWIDYGDTVDIVPDRQGVAYNDTYYAHKLLASLDEHDIRSRAPQAPRDQIWQAFSKDKFHVWMRRAGGYVYVTAWIGPSPDEDTVLDAWAAEEE